MRVFVDTSALLALAHAKDQYHARAVAISRKHQGAGGRYLSSVLVLSELHTHLLYLRGPVAARATLERLLADPSHDWRPVTPELLADATARWITRFADQRFSLVDAVSFELMSHERIARAFAFDRHFAIAGFGTLR